MRALILLVVLASVAHAKPKRARPKQATTQMSAKDAAIVMRFFDHFIDVMKGAMDCQAVAGRINLVIDRNRELVRLIAEASAQGRQMPKPMQDKMTLRMTKELMPVVEPCMSDPDVVAAFGRFLTPRPQPQIN
jgi:hypothetical protein